MESTISGGGDDCDDKSTREIFSTIDNSHSTPINAKAHVGIGLPSNPLNSMETTV